ncbi:hypothetical protein BDQ17DRAFT_1371346 [Cyathus striatus]|nr:hypothetical protein BDQ17DRAFT_1371346 [Cyathus striatus]
MKWSLPKLLYIVARYSSLFYLLYAEVSHDVRHLKNSFQTYYSYPPDVPAGAVDLIFILRVCTLYGNSKRIIFCLTVLFIGVEKY